MVGRATLIIAVLMMSRAFSLIKKGKKKLNKEQVNFRLLLIFLHNYLTIFSLFLLSDVVAMRRIPDPIALYPLNNQYKTRELENRQPQGTPVGVTLAAGPNGKAGGSYQFTGQANSYIEFPNNGGLDTERSITMLCWLYPQSTDGPIFNYKTSGLWGVHMWMVLGKLFARFTKRNYQFTQPLITCKPLSLNQWQFIGASYDYNTGVTSLWLDGQRAVQTNIGAGLTLATQDNVRMGAKEGVRWYFRGRIAAMQIYDVALTKRQVNAVKIASQGNRFEVAFSLVFLQSSLIYHAPFDHGLNDFLCSFVSIFYLVLHIFFKKKV